MKEAGNLGGLCMRSLFPRNYEVETNAELPPDGRGQVFYFPCATSGGRGTGLFVKVKPLNKLPWIGCFELGYRSAKALTEVISCPNPNEICVVSSGEGYVIRADSPTNWLKLPCFPITEALEAPAHGVPSVPTSVRHR